MHRRGRKLKSGEVVSQSQMSWRFDNSTLRNTLNFIKSYFHMLNYKPRENSKVLLVGQVGNSGGSDEYFSLQKVQKQCWNHSYTYIISTLVGERRHKYYLLPKITHFFRIHRSHPCFRPSFCFIRKLKNGCRLDF